MEGPIRLSRHRTMGWHVPRPYPPPRGTLPLQVGQPGHSFSLTLPPPDISGQMLEAFRWGGQPRVPRAKIGGHSRDRDHSWHEEEISIVASLCLALNESGRGRFVRRPLALSGERPDGARY